MNLMSNLKEWLKEKFGSRQVWVPQERQVAGQKQIMHYLNILKGENIKLHDKVKELESRLFLVKKVNPEQEMIRQKVKKFRNLINAGTHLNFGKNIKVFTKDFDLLGVMQSIVIYNEKTYIWYMDKDNKSMLLGPQPSLADLIYNASSLKTQIKQKFITIRYNRDLEHIPEVYLES